MEKQNITLALPRELIRKAKLLAVKRDSSLNEMIREMLQKQIEKEGGYRRAWARQKRILANGYNLGTRGRLSVSREDLHERR